MEFLLVEDKETDIDTCIKSLKAFNAAKTLSINLTVCNSIKEVEEKLGNHFDGAIIDLKLSDDQNDTSGNDVLGRIIEQYMIPTVVHSGQDQLDDRYKLYVKEIKKGSEDGYHAVFEHLLATLNTGIRNIFNPEGTIEKALRSIFWNELVHSMDDWRKYASSGMKTENGLLRQVMYHLFETLDREEASYFPPEMYIHTNGVPHFDTGEIVKNSTSGEEMIILTPACDMVIREKEVDGELIKSIKTDSILLCGVVSYVSVKAELYCGKTKNEDQKKRIEELVKNNFRDYYHFLPQYNNFGGGLINFRKVYSCDKAQFYKDFNKLEIKISSDFLKDIRARFTAYYARQGQPDFISKRIANLIKPLFDL